MACFSTPPLFDAPSGGTPCAINAIYTPLKSIFNRLLFTRWQCGSIFICLAMLAPKCANSREISREIEVIAVQRISRSSIMVSIESACDFLLLINSNFGRIPLPFSRYWRLKLENVLFSHPSLVWRPAWGNPLEFSDEAYPTKTRWTGYRENFIILASTVLTDPPVWRTDRQTVRRTGDSISLSICYMLSRAIKTAEKLLQYKWKYKCFTYLYLQCQLWTG